MNDILSVEEAAKLLGCSEDTLREKTPAIVPGRVGADPAGGLRPPGRPPADQGAGRAACAEAIEETHDPDHGRKMTLAMEHVLDDTGIDLFYETDTTGRSVSINADCLDALRMIPEQSVDMVLCDLPYGTTQNKWDSVIPFDQLWVEYRRVTKPNAAIVLTAAQPFTSALVMSNAAMFKQSLVWKKNVASNFLNANRQHLSVHEDVLLFAHKQVTFNKQMRPGKPYTAKRSGRDDTGDNYGSIGHRTDTVNAGERNPTTILEFDRETGQHPTQKPVALMEYLIRTYTDEGDTVLDNTMGSGTTGVACENTGRNFIGIERDPSYFAIAKDRIRSAYWSFCVEGFSEC